MLRPCSSGQGSSSSSSRYPHITEIEDTGAVETDAVGLCIVCWQKPRDAVLLECGHSGLCAGCAQKLYWRQRRCPLCRARIDSVWRIECEDLAAVCAPKPLTAQPRSFLYPLANCSHRLPSAASVPRTKPWAAARLPAACVRLSAAIIAYRALGAARICTPGPQLAARYPGLQGRPASLYAVRAI
jgi:hypothetical protein